MLDYITINIRYFPFEKERKCSLAISRTYWGAHAHCTYGTFGKPNIKGEFPHGIKPRRQAGLCACEKLCANPPGTKEKSQ